MAVKGRGIILRLDPSTIQYSKRRSFRWLREGLFSVPFRLAPIPAESLEWADINLPFSKSLCMSCIQQNLPLPIGGLYYRERPYLDMPGANETSPSNNRRLNLAICSGKAVTSHSGLPARIPAANKLAIAFLLAAVF